MDIELLYPTYTYAYIDPTCFMYGYGAEPIAASVDDDDATDTGGWDDDWHDWGDPVYDTHATGYTAPDNLPCTLMTWGYYEDYSGDEDADIGDEDGDWGEEEAPVSIPPTDEERYSSELVDVWTLELSAGDSVYVSVDVLDEANMSSPSFMVISPESCPIMYAGGEINCTANMDDWPSCPAAEFMADEDGTHYIMVSASTCSTEEAPYKIGVDAGTDPALTLMADNTTPYTWTPSSTPSRGPPRNGVGSSHTRRPLRRHRAPRGSLV